MYIETFYLRERQEKCEEKIDIITSKRMFIEAFLCASNLELPFLMPYPDGLTTNNRFLQEWWQRRLRLSRMAFFVFFPLI